MTHCVKTAAFRIALLLCIIWVSSNSALAESFAPVELRADVHSIRLGEKEVQYLIADQNHTDIQDILQEKTEKLWQSAHSSPLFLGNSVSSVWVRFGLVSSAEIPSNWILETTWPFFDQIELYRFDKKSGRIVRSQSKENQAAYSPLATHLPFAFALPTYPYMDQVVYLKLHSSAKMLLPLKIMQESTFEKESLYRHILLGLFFGTLLAMCCYNTSLFFFTRDDSYAFYVVYVISIILYTLGMTGVGQTYLWPGNSWMLSHAYGVFSSFSFLTAALFIRRFLALATYGGWPLRLSNLIIVYWSVMIAFYLVSNHHWLISSEDYGAVISCFVVLVTIIFCWYKGSIAAKYLTIAWTLLILSTFMLMMGLTGVVPYSPMAQNSQNIGIVVEVILLSLTLAERINRTRQEKEEAQAKILDMERQAKVELEKRVVLRTVELRQALEALETANKELGTLSLTDELTQLANRRHFNVILERECKRAIRYHQPLSLILADIDHFKKINDKFGHQVGDECLQHVAKILSSRAGRAEDLVARYGGEEFVVILPGASTDIAAATAERMRNEVQSTPYPVDDDHLRITLSFGVAGLSSEMGEQAKDLLNKADQALYRAKDKGRNRVEVLL
ncbi:MAG: sensor domain-containing diguanylate cyclase [Proteobacteria bacterium]|nr:sensor domain-containing diguanylate cyclase [Pseudomonadota bacterium]